MKQPANKCSPQMPQWIPSEGLSTARGGSKQDETKKNQATPRLTVELYVEEFVIDRERES